jgi:type II secretory pathway pseudopilin PulG
VELLVVVAIIGILAALLTPVINAAMQKGNQARCVGNLRSIGAAAGAWSAANNNQVLFQQMGNAKITPDWAGDWMSRILDFAPNASSTVSFVALRIKPMELEGTDPMPALRAFTSNPSADRSYIPR